MDENITYSLGTTPRDRRDLTNSPPDRSLRLLISHWKLMHFVVTPAHRPCLGVGIGGGEGGALCVVRSKNSPTSRFENMVWIILPKVRYLYHDQIFTIHPTLQRSSRATLISQKPLQTPRKSSTTFLSCLIGPHVPSGKFSTTFAFCVTIQADDGFSQNNRDISKKFRQSANANYRCFQWIGVKRISWSSCKSCAQSLKWTGHRHLCIKSCPLTCKCDECFHISIHIDTSASWDHQTLSHGFYRFFHV